MNPPIVLVVQLFIAPGRQRGFDEFEAEAAAIMARHGGSIQRRIALSRGDDAFDEPNEVHIVAFPARTALDSYLEDPALLRLAELRATTILRTVTWFGSDQPLPGV